MRLCITFTLAVLVSSSPWLTASGQEAPGAKTMDNRTVPAPDGVSKEFHELIATRQIAPALPVP